MGRRGKALGLTCVISLLLAGCQPIIDPNRYGPAPVLNSADVDASAQNQIKVLRGLASASALDLPAASGSSDWYLVMEAGFNYVDEECDRYITDLFIKNRERDRLKGLAVLADKTTSAILAASNASKEAMEIVAQSFGFAEGATDLIANSYLFQIDPAHIQNLVAGMRRAYRQKAYEK
ncbi:MAG TPA: hypothetical protein VKS78_05740, partial [Roseiarcus sp.]|nr:hypothetical protein [Roseiarcus sp.]